MLQASGISRAFGDKIVLDNLSLTVKNGAIAGLIGPSGSGKSVLMKILGDVSEPDSGDIDYSDIIGGDSDAHSAIGLMFQEGALFDSISVFDNVAFPLVHGRVPTTTLSHKVRLEVYGKVSEILARVGLSDAINKMPAQLSGGMRRRVSLARALVARPALVLLDDPTCGLDPVASSVIMNLIVELHREYKPTLLMVSHDLRRLLPVVDTIYALYDGRIQFSGSLDELRQCNLEFLRAFVSCRFDLDQAA